MDVERPVSYIVKFELDDHGSRRKGKTRGPYLWYLTEPNTETSIKVNELLLPVLVQADPWPLMEKIIHRKLMKLFINRHADDHEYTSLGGAGVNGNLQLCIRGF